MSERAIAGILGLALRSRQLLLGAGRSLDHIRSKHSGTLLIDSGASENTRKRFSDACAHHQVASCLMPRDLLGNALGQPGTMVALLLPGGLNDKLRKECVSLQQGLQ